MEEDLTLFGHGRYPAAGPLAILARLAFLGALLAVVVAVFLPPHLVPRFSQSEHLEHFAAFYVVLVTAHAALPQTPLRRVATGLAIFASVLESTHLLGGAELHPVIENWVADMGGITAAMAPIVVERFRRRMRLVKAVPLDPSAQRRRAGDIETP
jgi:hypothetical protein